MDLLLIDPPYRILKGAHIDVGYNLGLPSLAAFLREKGMDAQVITCDLYEDVPEGMSALLDLAKYAAGQRHYLEVIEDDNHPIWRKILADVAKANTKLVGISFLTPTIHSVEKVIRIIKQADPSIQIVVGGHHPSLLPDEVMRNPNIDFIIRGEGELPLYELVRTLHSKAPDLQGVPSLTYRKDGIIIHNPAANPITNLDILPFMARDVVINCDYDKHQSHYLTSARGCPYSCSFCADKKLWSGVVRRKSLGKVIDELLMLKQNYKVKMLDIVDGTFTYDKQYLLSFCDIFVKNKINLPWRCMARYDNIDAEVLSSLKKAQCQGLYFGLESGSDRILKAMNKKINLDMIIEKSEMVYNAGIDSVASVLLGTPDERREDIESTIRFMRKIKVNFFDVNSYVPLPGTPYYEKMSSAERQKIDWEKTGFKSWDNFFANNISPEEFRQYIGEAYAIAKDIMLKSLAKKQRAVRPASAGST